MQTTIEFRDMQATYTFPVGVTTLWWYAPNEGHSFDGELVNATAAFRNSTERVVFKVADAEDKNGAAVKVNGDAEFDEDSVKYSENINEQTPLFRFREHL